MPCTPKFLIKHGDRSPHLGTGRGSVCAYPDLQVR